MTAPEFTLLDGGMGRELRRRSLIEPATIWSGSALIDHPQTASDIHAVSPVNPPAHTVQL